jgi:hypothetical protein
VDQDLYQGDPVIWWKNVGAKKFPRLNLLAADLLFIPASTTSVERLFNHMNAIISPRKSCLNRYIIAQTQSLSNWRKNGIYQATKDWKQTLPIIEIK